MLRKKKWKTAYLFLIIGLQIWGLARAQEETGGNWVTVRLRNAAQDFAEGRFYAVIDSLDRYDIQGYTSQQKRNAYPLLAKAYLALDYQNEAREMVNELLEAEPGYEPDVWEWDAFKDLVLKNREKYFPSQISSVSKRAEKVAEAPAHVCVITAEELRERGYLDLESLFHDLPGFDISRGSGPIYSNIYPRGYRNETNDRMLLLIDGVEENDLWSNAMLLSRQYPLSYIKQIEIIYGPASTMYGANAFLGVINIVTKDPADILRRNDRFGVRAQVSYGSWNTHSTDFMLAGRFAGMNFSITSRFFQSDEMNLSRFTEWNYQPESVDYYLDLLQLRNQADGLLLAQQAQQADAAALAQRLGGRTVEFGNSSSDWLVHGKLYIGNWSVGIQTWHRAEGSIGWYKDDYRASQANGVSWIPRLTFLYVKYYKKFNNRLTITNFSRFKYHDMDPESNIINFESYASGRLDLDDLRNNRPAFWETTYYYRLSRQLRSELTAVYEHSDKIDFVSGIEFRTSMIQGDYLRAGTSDSLEYVLPNENILGGNYFNSLDLGFYFQGTWRPKQWLKLVAGQRIDHNRIRFSGGYGTVYNSRLAAVLPYEKFLVKAIFSQAFMDAGYRVKYSIVPGKRDLPNPNLKPERVNNFEIFAKYNFTDNVSIDFGAYTAYYNGAIAEKKVAISATDSTFQNQSIGKLHISGFYSDLNFSWWRFKGYANYTFTHPFNTEPLDKNGNPIPGASAIRIGDIAKHHLNWGLNTRINHRFNFHLRMNYVGPRETGKNTTVTNNPYDQIDAYTVFHGAFSYSSFTKENLTLQLVVNNIFNKLYYDPGIRNASDEYVARIPQNSRTLSMRVLYEF